MACIDVGGNQFRLGFKVVVQRHFRNPGPGYNGINAGRGYAVIVKQFPSRF